MREFDQTKDISISQKTGENGMPSSTGKDLADQLLKLGQSSSGELWGRETSNNTSHLLPPFVSLKRKRKS